MLTGTKLAQADDEAVTFFRDCLKGALIALDILDSTDCSRQQAREARDEVFDTAYFSNRPDDDPSNKAEC